MAHAHHELMRQYAEDAAETDSPWEKWECRPRGSDAAEWSGFSTHPSWARLLDYRRKPSTIRIGEYDVPEPMREAPKFESGYWVPLIMSAETPFEYKWTDHRHDRLMLSLGLCHSAREAAVLHAKALVSLTSKAM